MTPFTQGKRQHDNYSLAAAVTRSVCRWRSRSRVLAGSGLPHGIEENTHSTRSGTSTISSSLVDFSSIPPSATSGVSSMMRPMKLSIGLALSLLLTACNCPTPPTPTCPPGPGSSDAGSVADAGPRPDADMTACQLPPCGQDAAVWVAWGKLCLPVGECQNITCPHAEVPMHVCGAATSGPVHF